jgi:hypothetical protein
VVTKRRKYEQEIRITPIVASTGSAVLVRGLRTCQTDKRIKESLERKWGRAKAEYLILQRTAAEVTRKICEEQYAASMEFFLALELLESASRTFQKMRLSHAD